MSSLKLASNATTDFSFLNYRTTPVVLVAISVDVRLPTTNSYAARYIVAQLRSVETGNLREIRRYVAAGEDYQELFRKFSKLEGQEILTTCRAGWSPAKWFQGLYTARALKAIQEDEAWDNHQAF